MQLQTRGKQKEEDIQEKRKKKQSVIYSIKIIRIILLQIALYVVRINKEDLPLFQLNQSL